MRTTINLDLGMMLAAYIEKRLAEYEEPHSKREGRPFAATYRASILALTSMSIREQAESLGLDPAGLKTTRTKQRFKNLVKQHMAAFTAEVLIEILSDTITGHQSLWEYSVSNDDTPYHEADIKINVGPLSWECYRQIIGAVLGYSIDRERLRQICGEVLVKDGEKLHGYHLYLITVRLFSLFVGPLLEGARKFYGWSKREVEQFKAAAFKSHLELCSRLILKDARKPGDGDEERANLIEKYFTLLLRVHGVQTPGQRG